MFEAAYVYFWNVLKEMYPTRCLCVIFINKIIVIFTVRRKIIKYMCLRDFVACLQYDVACVRRFVAI